MAKRQNLAHRTASGRLSMAGVRDIPPAKIKRTLDKLMHEASDPLAGSSIGRLFLGDRISADAVSAASRYGELWKRYSAVHGLPSPSARAMDFSAVRGISGDEVDDETADRITAAWGEAHSVLLMACGEKGAARVFAAVVLEQAVVTVDDVSAVSRGLVALANHWAGQKRQR